MPAMPSALFIAAAISPATNVPCPCVSATDPPTKRARRATMRLARSGCVASMPESTTATFTGRQQRRLGPEVEGVVLLQVPLLRRERVVRRERDAAAARAEPLDPADAVDAPHAAHAPTLHDEHVHAAEVAADAAVGAQALRRRAAATQPRSTPTAKRAASAARRDDERSDGCGREGGRAAHCSETFGDSARCPAAARHDARAVDAAGRRRCEAEPARCATAAPSQPSSSAFPSCWIWTGVPGSTGRTTPLIFVRSALALSVSSGATTTFVEGVLPLSAVTRYSAGAAALTLDRVRAVGGGHDRAVRHPRRRPDEPAARARASPSPRPSPVSVNGVPYDERLRRQRIERRGRRR